MSFRIEHRIGVAAPAETIWLLVSEVERWGEWNPLYKHAGGGLRMGETLKLTETLPERPPRSIAPVIIDWEPRSLIHWRENGTLARTVRYIEIEALTETGCVFSNGAFFHGVFGETQAKSQRSAIYRGYESLSEAVKKLSEERWREQQSGAQ